MEVSVLRRLFWICWLLHCWKEIRSLKHALLPARAPSGRLLAPFIKASIETAAYSDHNVILFVTNENTTVDGFDHEVISHGYPYLFLRQHCFSPKAKETDEGCLDQSFPSAVQQFSEAFNGISKAVLLVLFLSRRLVNKQMFVIHEIIALNKITDIDTRILLVVSDKLSERETRDVFSRLVESSIQSSAQAIVWNKSVGDYVSLNMRCRTPVETTIRPHSVYSYFHQRSLGDSYNLYFKDDESKLLKEVLSEVLPSDSFTKCFSEGESWIEVYKTAAYFEKSQGDFGQQLDSRSLYPHLQNDFCFLVRRAQPLAFMENILKIYSTSIWILVVSVAGSVTLAHALLMGTKLSFRHNRVVILVTAAFETVRSIVTGSFTLWAGRLVFLPVLVSFTSLILSNGFCGDLTSVFTVPVYGNEINTLEDVYSNIDVIYYNLREINPEFIFDNPLMFGKRKMWIENAEFVDDVVQNERTSALLRQSEIKRFVLNPKYVNQGRPLLRQVPQCLYSPAYQSIQMTRINPYSSILNSRLLRAVQSGLWDKLERKGLDNYFSTLGTTALKVAQSSSARIEKLTVEKVGDLFMVLLFALTFCLFIFLLEVLSFWRKNKISVVGKLKRMFIKKSTKNSKKSSSLGDDA